MNESRIVITDFNKLLPARTTSTVINETNNCLENGNEAENIHRLKRDMLDNFGHLNSRIRDNSIQFDDDIDVDKLTKKNGENQIKHFDVSKRMGKVFKSGSITTTESINPTTVTQEEPVQKITNTTRHAARQNSNPDIQDIITGIVKLLNGNVNVHANVQQPQRRPSHIRINNRGPPRISEAQPLPSLEYTDQPPHILPPNKPYPFDRPAIVGGGTSPIRPYFNGMIEQSGLPPSLEQNYRPAFVSQNRPPWQRPRPPFPIMNGSSNINQRPNLSMKKETIGNKYKATNQLAAQPATINDSIFQHTMINSSSTLQSNTIYDTKPAHLLNGDEESLDNTEIRTTVILEENTTELNDFEENNPNILNLIDITSPKFTELHSSISPIASIESSLVEFTSTPHLMPTLPLLSQFNYSKTQLSVLSTELTTLNSIKSTTHDNIPFSTRQGIVLDDPDFSRQNHRPHIRPTSSIDLQGYGEIFDVTLSAVQGLAGGTDGASGPQQIQTIKLNPYHKPYLDMAGDAVVSIDGKKSYINLFQTLEPSAPNTPTLNTLHVSATQQQTLPSDVIGTGYAIVEKETVIPPPFNYHQQKHPYKPKPLEQNLVRIDTCIVGEDSTCDLAQNEKCKIENGVSSCHCKPGYARKKDRDPCRKIVSILMCLRVDKIYDKKIIWDNQLMNKKSDSYRQLSYESIRAIDSALSMTPFSDEFLDAYVNNIFNGDASQGFAGVFVNLTLQLEENTETLRPNVKSDLQKHLLGVINRRNNNIGNSLLYVESSLGSISNLQDLDECTSTSLNDCHPNAICQNIWGSFRCQCKEGLRDPWSDHVQRSGRECLSCSREYCNNRGTCSFKDSNQVCSCDGSFYGVQCEIDGEVLGVAIGASVAAIIIILLTLVCLIMWSRKWQKEHKNALEGTMFGYVSGTQLKSPYSPYPVSLEDRLRWMNMSELMGQLNHYEIGATSPIPSCPNLHMASNGGTLVSIADSKRSNAGPFQPKLTMPPADYGYPYNVASTVSKNHLDNSSCLSEEETCHADLLERNFELLRPRSRTNASVTGQSGIYYDVDIDSSEANLYDVTRNSPALQKHYIPMSTYSVGGGINSTYYKN